MRKKSQSSLYIYGHLLYKFYSFYTSNSELVVSHLFRDLKISEIMVACNVNFHMLLCQEKRNEVLSWGYNILDSFFTEVSESSGLSL